jgi:[ribosomal protein S5]-alanine N-acetyltransferase
MELRGSCVVLRDFRASDRLLFIDAVSDPKMFTFTKIRMDRDAVNQAMIYLAREPEIVPRRTFNLALQTNEVEFAGWAALGGMTDTGSAEIGWYLRPDQWGRGYATEATQLLLNLAFEDLTRNCVIATSDPDNQAAHRVLERSGLRREHEILTVDTWRGPRPRYLYSISDQAWRDGRRDIRHSGE